MASPAASLVGSNSVWMKAGDRDVGDSIMGPGKPGAPMSSACWIGGNWKTNENNGILKITGKRKCSWSDLEEQTLSACCDSITWRYYLVTPDNLYFSILFYRSWTNVLLSVHLNHQDTDTTLFITHTFHTTTARFEAGFVTTYQSTRVWTDVEMTLLSSWTVHSFHRQWRGFPAAGTATHWARVSGPLHWER